MPKRSDVLRQPPQDVATRTTDRPALLGRLVASIAFAGASWSVATGRFSIAGFAFVALLGHQPIRWWFRSR